MRGTAGLRNDPSSTAALGVLFQSPAQNLPALFNVLAGTIYGDTLMAGVNQSRVFGQSVQDNMAATSSGESTSNVTRVSTGPGVTMWLSGIGEDLRANRDGNTGYSASSGGFAVGADKQLGAFTVGLAAGVDTGTVTSRDTAAQASLTTVHFSSYGRWTRDALFADAQLGFNYGDAPIKRYMPSFGPAATGSFSAVGVSAGAEVGRVYSFSGPFSSWHVAPIVGVRLDQGSRGGLSESGAGSLSLRIAGQDVVSARTRVGGRIGTSVSLAPGYVLSPTARLFWSHELGDQSTTTTQAFSGGMTSLPVTVKTARTGRDGAETGVAAELSTPIGATVFAAYNADIFTNSVAQAFTGGVRFRW